MRKCSSVLLPVGFTLGLASAPAWSANDNCTVLGRGIVVCEEIPTAAPEAATVSTFATLPAGMPGNPEGMTVDAQGNIYVASFALADPCPSAAAASSRAALSIPANGFFPARVASRTTAQQSESAPNFIYIYGPNGDYVDAIPLDCSLMPPGSIFPPVPLGMTFDLAGNLYVNDVFHCNVLKFSPPFSAGSKPTDTYDLCGGFIVAFGFPGEFGALNDITLGPDGYLYVSDNGAGDFGQFEGKVYRVNPASGVSSVWYEDGTDGTIDLPPATPNGGRDFPNFSVNGLAFATDGSALYMAHMGDDRILKLPVDCTGAAGCQPAGDLIRWAESTNGIDDMTMINVNGIDYLAVTAGQEDRVQIFTEVPAEQCVLYFDADGMPTHECGKEVARAGSFEGVTEDGAIKGMLMPSSIVFSNGRFFACNEANPSLHPIPPTPDGWADIERYTVASFGLPPLP